MTFSRFVRGPLCFLFFSLIVHVCGESNLEAGVVTLDPSQISDNTFSNDVWCSPWMAGPTDGFIDVGETYTLDITFSDGKVLCLDDGYFNGDESIHFEVKGGTGFGVSVRTFDWVFDISGNGGPLTNNPVSGSGNFGLNGDASHDQDVDLINGGSLGVNRIRLSLTNTGDAPWSIAEVRVCLDADDIAICPEPSMMVIGSILGVGGLFAKRRMKKRSA